LSIPRFLLVAGVARGGVPKPAWPVADVPFTGDLGDDDSWVSWRLTSGNHRELGRSMPVFADVDLAVSSIKSLRDTLVNATHSIVAGPHGDRWTWRLEVDGVTVATSGRTFSRRRECLYNLEAFLSAAPEAEVLHSFVRRGPAPQLVATGNVNEYAE
jgi:hypothetical protein